jgi:hypothetical protein
MIGVFVNVGKGRGLGAAVLCACIARATVALAGQDAASAGLAASERAFDDVDFATAYDQAVRAIEAGGATRDETARLYVLVGRTAAALGRAEEAKRAFIVALAVDPNLKLEQTLSPKIRAPYLEALGYWGAHSERLELAAKASADKARISVKLVDPAHLATKIALRVDVAGAGHDEAFVTDAKGSVNFNLSREASTRGFDYFVQAVDDHKNVLAELGTDSDPRQERGAGATTGGAPPSDAYARRGQSYFWPAALAVAGFGAVGVGIAFHVQRENAARDWNGPGCERSGLSRIEQCGDVDSRLRTDESVAIGGYVAGGALLTGSIITLLVGHRGSEPGPEPMKSGLRGCAVAGMALSCSGHF